jgi:hypothetical protein
VEEVLGGKSPYSISMKDGSPFVVLGDLGKGNSDPALVQFGRAITPNFHKIASELGGLESQCPLPKHAQRREFRQKLKDAADFPMSHGNDMIKRSNESDAGLFQQLPAS